jgi:hypothetical protein
MTVAYAPGSAVELIVQIENRIEMAGLSRVYCLVIAHDDEQMAGRLVDAADAETVVVVRWDQAEWSAGLAEVVKWAAERGVLHVLVAGHSQTVNDAMDAEAGGSGEGQQSSASFKNIVAGACEIEQRLQLAKEQFAATMVEFSNSETLADVSCDDSFRLTPLFYVAHSDHFMRFDFATSSFVPLDV